MDIYISKNNLATNSTVKLVGNTPLTTGILPDKYVYSNVLSDDFSKNIELIGSPTIINELHFGVHNDIDYICIIGNNIPNDGVIEFGEHNIYSYSSISRLGKNIFIKLPLSNYNDFTVKFTGVSTNTINITQISFGKLMNKKTSQPNIIIPEITTKFNESTSINELSMPVSKKNKRKNENMSIILQNEIMYNAKNEWQTFANNFSNKTFFICLTVSNYNIWIESIPCFNLDISIKNNNSTRLLVNISLKFKTFFGN